MMLATEIMRQLRRHRQLRRAGRARRTGPRGAHRAVDAGGFDDLTVQPTASIEGFSCTPGPSRSSGSRSSRGRSSRRPRDRIPCPAGLPRGKGLRGRVRRLLAGHASAAACEGNLRRLAREYRRTERRARALENVLLPEIDLSLRYIEEQLDALDQEEAVRVRNAGVSRSRELRAPVERREGGGVVGWGVLEVLGEWREGQGGGSRDGEGIGAGGRRSRWRGEGGGGGEGGKGACVTRVCWWFRGNAGGGE